ncbi:MAG: hypothetical protein HYX68_14475 [Planctomycetes bacterium]|nr:hypothetical protein [Planctomycetota bacterium]
MRHHLARLPFFALLVTLATSGVLHAQDGKSQRQPKRFAIIFNKGYAGDHFPKDPAAFEKMIQTIKAANFNVILGIYDPQRAAICKKHDIQIFVDLVAAPHHVYKNVDACKKLLGSLRNDPTVYGYHLWSDNIAGTAPGRSRDVKNVQEWDGTHPAYVGSYRMSKVSKVIGMDAFGYYDFHWTRGGHWGHLNQAFNVARARQVPFLRYDAANPGLVGKGNPNRAGYTIATSIPFGLKGYMYHYAGGIVNAKMELDALGRDVQKVNAKFASVGAELMKLGTPSAVYSTPITRDTKNKPLPAAVIPGGLTPIPKDSWFQVKSGEILIGVSKDGGKRDVLILACHNPYETQKVTFSLNAGIKKAEGYDRAKGAWMALPITNGQVNVGVEDYAVELVRFQRQGPAKQ